VIKNAILLERLKKTEAKKIIRLLDKLKSELIKKLETELTDFQTKRLNQLLSDIEATIDAYYGKINDDMTNTLYDVAKAQEQAAINIINNRFTANIASTSLSATKLNTIVNKPILSKLQSTTLKKLSKNLTKSIKTEVKAGIIRGDTTKEIIKNVDNEFDLPKRHLASHVKTAIHNVSSRTFEDVYAQNADIVKYIQQVSVLDTRTSNICMAYSNKMWTNTTDHKPVKHSLPYNNGVPRHYNCRSQMIPRFDTKAIKAKRASFKGPIQVDSFEEFFKKMTEQERIKLVGPTINNLIKEKKITDFKQLVDSKGEPLSIKELVSMYK